MRTGLIILALAVLIIAVNFAYENVLAWFRNLAAHRFLVESLARFSAKLNSSKFLVGLKTLTEQSCPYCSDTHMRRSHRYSFEKPLSIFGLWPYRCLHCKARFLKMLGRHFDNAQNSTRGET